MINFLYDSSIIYSKTTAHLLLNWVYTTQINAIITHREVAIKQANESSRFALFSMKFTNSDIQCVCGFNVWNKNPTPADEVYTIFIVPKSMECIFEYAKRQGHDILII